MSSKNKRTLREGDQRWQIKSKTPKKSAATLNKQKMNRQMSNTANGNVFKQGGLPDLMELKSQHSSNSLALKKSASRISQISTNEVDSQFTEMGPGAAGPGGGAMRETRKTMYRRCKTAFSSTSSPDKRNG